MLKSKPMGGGVSGKGSEELQLEVLRIRKAALILRVINHKLRQQILKLLHEYGKMTVTDIYVKLKMEQSVASQHLALLRKADFVHTERDGKFVFYSVNYDRLAELQSLSDSFLK